MPADLTFLDDLEAEAIHIIRECAASFDAPVMLYSVGKDSSVLLHLARKAFYPAPLPMPLLHIDTGWKFREMISFRQSVATQDGIEVRVRNSADASGRALSPFEEDAAAYTHVMKTMALRQALDEGGFDAAIGGARRDEEKSRAKERIFSIRSRHHSWDPKTQRPELWRIYNSRLGDDQSMRVFPLSNWTELDVWLYIWREAIPVVPLYFARERPVVSRDGTLIMVDDDRFVFRAGERAERRQVRFRTLGCYPLTGAVESEADTLEAVILEMWRSRTSERQNRLIDRTGSDSMERKKREGYF